MNAKDFNTKLNLLIASPKFKKVSNFILINHYYDTEKLDLYKNGDTLRIRQNDISLVLEYKKKQATYGEKRICKEFSKPVEILSKFISCPEAFDLAHKNNNFKYLGSTTTSRIKFESPDVDIFFDKNYYLGNLDYEIEIETSENADISVWKKLLNIINLKGNFHSKYERFAETYIKFEL